MRRASGRGAIYAQNGTAIAAADATGRIWLYRGGVGGWEAYACQLAARNLTRAERARFVPGQPYRRICPAGG